MTANTENRFRDLKILTQTAMMEGLKDKKLYVVADRIGLSYPTLKKLADGKDGNYTIETLQAVSDYIENN